MNKWQHELQELKLTAEQKQQMKQAMQAQKPIKTVSRNWTWMVVPAFIIVLAFCSMLLFTDTPSDLQQHAAQLQTKLDEPNHEKYILLHMSLNFVISILIVSNIVLFMLTIVKTKRWQGRRIHQIRRNIIKTRYFHLLYAIVFLILNTVALSSVNLSVQTKSIIIYTCLLLVTYILILWSARNQKEHVDCPHCQHRYVASEKRKLVMRFTLELRCKECDGKLYHAKKTRQASGVITFIMMAFILLPSNFGIPFWYVCTVGFGSYFIIIYYLFPLFLELEGEEKPLF